MPASEREDVALARFSSREKFAVSPRMMLEMQTIADRRGISRSQAWREAAAAYIAAAEGETR